MPTACSALLQEQDILEWTKHPTCRSKWRVFTKHKFFPPVHSQFLSPKDLPEAEGDSALSFGGPPFLLPEWPCSSSCISPGSSSRPLCWKFSFAVEACPYLALDALDGHLSYPLHSQPSWKIHPQSLPLVSWSHSFLKPHQHRRVPSSCSPKLHCTAAFDWPSLQPLALLATFPLNFLLSWCVLSFFPPMSLALPAFCHFVDSFCVPFVPQNWRVWRLSP